MDEDFLSPNQPKPAPSLKDNFIELFQTVVVFAAILTAVYWLVAQPHRVSGESMFPNFKDGDFIITDKLTYKFADPHKGDVVVFKNPRNENEDFIKRIMGVPGDRLKVENGKVYINDKLIDEPYLKSVTTDPRSFMHEGEEVTVEQGKFAVFGDNRPRSSDTREWGFITKEEIIGRVLLRYWPQNSIGVFPAAYSIKV